MSGSAAFDPTLPAVDLARDLLGRTLVRIDEEGRRRAGVIVETEAYPGGDDRASHSRGGHRTPRNESMFLAGGHLYVYLIYGMYHCLNVVSGPAGHGEAVLIRAIRPTEGVESMRLARPGRPDRELAGGPGRLCQALAIDRRMDGRRLGESGAVFLEGREPVGPISAAPRIGVDGAGEWALRPWRFLCGDRTWWSRPPRRSDSDRTPPSC